MTDELNCMVRQSSELESNIVAVERVKEYSDLSKEVQNLEEYLLRYHNVLISITQFLQTPFHDNSKEVDLNWPSRGDICFNNFKVRYREGLDLVLKGINCDIRSTEKVSIMA